MKNILMAVACAALFSSSTEAQDINIIIIGFGNTVTIDADEEPDEASGLWFDEHDSGLLSYRGIRCRSKEVADPCACGEWTTLCVRCWSRCGRYFIDISGRRWDVEGDPIPCEDRHRKVTGALQGRRLSVVFYCPATGDAKYSRSFIGP